jgi:hypothetical protein
VLNQASPVAEVELAREIRSNDSGATVMGYVFEQLQQVRLPISVLTFEDAAG